MSEPLLYKEAFPAGTYVRIAERPFLEEFAATWKYHHKLQQGQFEYANRVARVAAVGFYHGGDPVYTLDGAPGQWLEQCLRPSMTDCPASVQSQAPVGD